MTNSKMVSSTLVKISSPLARSCLVAISVTIFIDAILTIFAASSYPYLIDYSYSDLYIDSSRSITVVYTSLSVAAILVAISTAVASYKGATSYVLIHACITGVFLPVSILVYFTTISSRYKASEYEADYYHMIASYRINYDHHVQQESKLKLSSFINLIDSLQSKFSCCGVESSRDWIERWDNYIAPTCCKEQSSVTNVAWAQKFSVDPSHEFIFCNQSSVYHLGCLTALKEDEHSKYAWLSDLTVFLIVMTLMNTIISLLLFGLSKTENIPDDSNENELAIVGVSSKPRPSQPTITGIRPRVSVIHNPEQMAAISQAVRFNLSNSPRASISGPSKFSTAARRGSSFL